jgi:predicted transcriptional regulator
MNVRHVTCDVCGRVCGSSAIARHRSTHGDATALLSTVADGDRIKALYARGWSMRRIAAELHYSQTSVQRYLHAAGVQVRPRGGVNGRTLSAEEVLETAQLYGRGLSMAAIADLLGLTVSSVHERLHKIGVAVRPRGGPNHTGRSKAPEGERVRASRPVPPRAPQTAQTRQGGIHE